DRLDVAEPRGVPAAAGQRLGLSRHGRRLRLPLLAAGGHGLGEVVGEDRAGDLLREEVVAGRGQGLAHHRRAVLARSRDVAPEGTQLSLPEPPRGSARSSRARSPPRNTTWCSSPAIPRDWRHMPLSCAKSTVSPSRCCPPICPKWTDEPRSRSASPPGRSTC